MRHAWWIPKISLTLLFLFLTSCTHINEKIEDPGTEWAVQKTEPSEKQEVIAYPFDQTWLAVTAVLRETSWTIKSMGLQKNRGLITTEIKSKEFNTKEVICPEAPGLIIRYRARLNIVAKSTSENETNVWISTEFEGWEESLFMGGGGGKWTSCTSTGKIEEELLSKISSASKHTAN